MNIPRLERLARILDTADEKHLARGELGYNQSGYTHDCGTPSCALGHYAAATPKRWRFDSSFLPELRQGERRDAFSDAVIEFGITRLQVKELFGGYGCGRARTAKQAARYIRAFIKRNRSGAK